MASTWIWDRAKEIPVSLQAKSEIKPLPLQAELEKSGEVAGWGSTDSSWVYLSCDSSLRLTWCP